MVCRSPLGLISANAAERQSFSEEYARAANAKAFIVPISVHYRANIGIAPSSQPFRAARANGQSQPFYHFRITFSWKRSASVRVQMRKRLS